MYDYSWIVIAVSSRLLFLIRIYEIAKRINKYIKKFGNPRFSTRFRITTRQFSLTPTSSSKRRRHVYPLSRRVLSCHVKISPELPLLAPLTDPTRLATERRRRRTYSSKRTATDEKIFSANLRVVKWLTRAAATQSRRGGGRKCLYVSVRKDPLLYPHYWYEKCT